MVVQLDSGVQLGPLSREVKIEAASLTGDQMVDSVNLLASKLQVILESASWVYNDNNKLRSQVKTLDAQLHEKLLSSTFENKMDRFVLDQKRLHEENRRLAERDQMDTERRLRLITRLTRLIEEMTVKMKENEKKTLWKIDECEKITIQKVNKEYVDSS